MNRNVIYGIRPVDEEELVYAKENCEAPVKGNFAVCDFTRQVYHLADGISDIELKEQIKDLCIKMLAFQTRMDNALRLYVQADLRAHGHQTIPGYRED